MRRILVVALLLALLPPSRSWAEGENGGGQEGGEAVARAFLERLIAGDFDGARAQLDDAMAKALPGNALETIWAGLVERAGAVTSLGDATTRTVGAHTVVDVECPGARRVLVLRVSVDADRRVAGLFVVGDRPRAADPSAVRLETPTGTLYGTVDLPEGAGPFPAVLLIAGSGPTDRDGNGMGLVNDHLKRLGRALAAEGFAVVRYDKRGIGDSAAAGAREEDLRIETYASDAEAWMAWMQEDGRFGEVGLIGHSEGSLVGMLAARRAEPFAFVSLAGPGRPAAEVLREQLATKLPPALRARSDEILEALLAGRTVEDVPPGLASLYRPSVQPYLISWLRHDPLAVLKEVACPVLVVQGDRDVQVTVADARRLGEAGASVRVVVIEGLNHVLRRVATDAEQTRSYMDASLPLHPDLARTLAGFLRRARERPKVPSRDSR